MIIHNDRWLGVTRHSSVKPGFHMVITIAEYACDHVLKRVVNISLQIYFVKHEYLQSLQLCEDQGVPGKLKKRVCSHVLVLLTTYMETRLNPISPGGYTPPVFVHHPKTAQGSKLKLSDFEDTFCMSNQFVTF